LKLALKIFLWGSLVIIISVLMVAFYALQSMPHIKQAHIINAQAASHSQNVVKRLTQQLKSTIQPTVLSVSQDELNGLTALVHRALPKSRININIHRTVVIAQLSVELPLPTAFKYVNISATVLPSNYGLLLGKVEIGDVNLSGRWLINITKWAANTFLKDNIGNDAFNTIKWMMISQDNILVAVQLPDGLHKNKKQDKSPFAMLRDHLALFGDVEHVQFYYHSLLQYAEKAEPKASLANYVGYMFKLANEQSLRGVEISAVKENYTALTALSLYFGSNRFEFLVGDVADLSAAQFKRRRLLRGKTTLADRTDLQKHFIYSVALQLFGTSDASDAIGEIKEFLDSNKGGSGFSFADLLADRAGTRLAKLATQSESSAIYVQHLLSGITSESKIMPLIIGLPEGITAANFEQKYRNVNSPQYQEMMNIIDERLSVVEVYRVKTLH
jgi:hypothetical protein